MTNPENQNPLQLLFQPPPVAALNSPESSVNKSTPRVSTTYTWNARISFHQEKVKTTPRDRLAILIAELQQIDEDLQLLPYDEASLNNSITASKNIPTKPTKLQGYIGISETANINSKNLYLYV